MLQLENLFKVLRDIKRGIKGYFQAQLSLMIISFLIFSIGLVLIDAPHPLLMAFIIALVDILPVVGSGIIMIPWALISFLLANTDFAISLGLVYLLATIIRQLIEPKITGDKIGLRPLYTFIATIVGSFIFGPIGVILGPIMAIIIKSITSLNKE